MFSYRIQVYCASIVYSDESATCGYFKCWISNRIDRKLTG